MANFSKIADNQCVSGRKSLFKDEKLFGSVIYCMCLAAQRPDGFKQRRRSETASREAFKKMSGAKACCLLL